MANPYTDKNKKPHEEFAGKIINLLKENAAPWQKSWKAGEYFSPLNPASGTVYRGINNMMLSEKDFIDPRWMTLKQANDEGYRIKKGSKAVPIVYWQLTKEKILKDAEGRPILDDNGETKLDVVHLDRPRIYRYSVFHISQMQTLDGEKIPPYEPKELQWDSNEKAENILRQSGAVIFHDQRNSAFYKPLFDTIHLPLKENFENADDYYKTALHELGHWATAKNRLNIGSDGVFGSASYAKEELKVEIASWMICRELGLDYKPEKNTSYVASWLKTLNDDPYEIARACSDAEKIKNYVLGLSQEITHNPDLSASPAAEAASKFAPNWYDNLTVPEDHQYTFPEYLEVIEPSKEFKIRMAQDYEYCVEKIYDFLNDKESAYLEKNLRRDLLAASLIEAVMINRSLSMAGIPPENSIFSNGNLLKLDERLALPDDYKFSFPDLNNLTSEQISKKTRKELIKSYSEFLTITDLAMAEIAFNDFNNDLEPEKISNLAVYLTETSYLHKKLSELKVFDSTNKFPYENLVKSIKGIEKLIPENENINEATIPFKKELATLIIDSSKKVLECSNPTQLPQTLVKIKEDFANAMVSSNFETLETKVESTISKLVVRRINQILPDIDNIPSDNTFIAAKGELATLAHIIAIRSGSEADQQVFTTGIKDYLEAHGRSSDELVNKLTGKNVNFYIGDTTYLEWCVMDEALENYSYKILCRKEGENWREPTGGELERLHILEGANKLTPAISLNEDLFLTYDGLIHTNSRALSRHNTSAQSRTPNIDQIDVELINTVDSVGENELDKIIKEVINEATVQEPKIVTENKFLKVPYKIRGEAKAAGAKWDKDNKLWYAPIGSDLNKFTKWVPEKEAIVETNISPETEFANVLKEAGFIVNGLPIMDGTIQRLPVADGRKGNKDGAYLAYADNVPNGWICNHKTGEQIKWVASGHQLDDKQLLNLKIEIADQQKEKMILKEAAYSNAAQKASMKLSSPNLIQASLENPYLKTKNVKNYGVMQDDDGNLLLAGIDLKQSDFLGMRKLPAIGIAKNIDDFSPIKAIQTIQTIKPDGQKRYEKGCKKTGSAFVIGEDLLQKIAFDEYQKYLEIPLLQMVEEKPKILIAEGYATGASLYEATGFPVVVAFDAGNLKIITEILHEQFPSAEIIICADNDHKLETNPQIKENVGLERALDAAKNIPNAIVIYPRFNEEEKKQGFSDFNDFAISRGTWQLQKEVISQINELKKIEISSPEIQKKQNLER